MSSTDTKTSNIDTELEWLESKLKEILDYVNANPYHKVKDRYSTDKKKVVATIESIQTSIRNALKDYTSLLDSVNKLREAEKAKLEARGNAKITSRMEKLISK